MSSTDTIRAFVGLGFAEQGNQALAQTAGSIQRGLGESVDLRWIPKQNYHLTLGFLGQVNENQSRTAFRDALALIEQKHSEWLQPEPASGNRLIWLPSPAKPKVLALEVSTGDWLPLLANRLRQELAKALAIDIDDRFHPHVSIARAKQLPSAQGQAIAQVAVPKMTLLPRSLALFRSDQESEGVSYSALETYHFG